MYSLITYNLNIQIKIMLRPISFISHNQSTVKPYSFNTSINKLRESNVSSISNRPLNKIKQEVYFSKLIKLYEKNQLKKQQNQLIINSLNEKILKLKQKLNQKQYKSCKQTMKLLRQQFDSQYSLLRDQILKLQQILISRSQQIDLQNQNYEKELKEKQSQYFQIQQKRENVLKEINMLQKQLVNKKIMLKNDQRKLSQQKISLDEKEHKQQGYNQIKRKIQSMQSSLAQ